MDKPRIGKIIANDYIAMIAVVSIFVLPAVLVFAGLKEGGFDRYLSYAAVGIVLAVAGFIARINWVTRILERGAPVRGVIREINAYKDRGRIEFDYEYAGHKLSAGMAVHLSKAVKELQPGDHVNVVVDREKPTRALLRDLFV